MFIEEPFWYNYDEKISMFIESLNSYERELLFESDNFSFENSDSHANNKMHPLPIFSPPEEEEEKQLNLVVLSYNNIFYGIDMVNSLFVVPKIRPRPNALTRGGIPLSLSSNSK